MTDLSDFFSHAWQTIGRAIAMAGIRAGLREVPETISKTVKRRCQAELKGLGILLRRLIFLMALHVQLAPVKPRLRPAGRRPSAGTGSAGRPRFRG
jgi:hypothetical protein